MYLNFEKTLIISVGFFLLFSAFYIVRGVAAEVLVDNGFGNLGFYSVGVLFIAFAVFSFISSNVVAKCGDRLALVGGSLTFSLYAATFILSSYYGDNPDLHAWYLNKTFIIVIVYVAAVLNGFGASIIWFTQ